MNLQEAKKIMKKATTEEREDAFYTLYGVKTQKEVLEQFKAKVEALKVIPYENKRMKKEKVEGIIEGQYQEQYIKLLELIMNYSHAMFFLYSKERINKNLSAYRKVSIESIKSDNVEKAFSSFKRLYQYQEEPQKEPQEELQVIVDSECLALEHIERLKSDLDNNNLNVRVDQEEDKKAYLKMAIISLATGANSKDITDVNHVVSESNSIYDFGYISTLISQVRSYQKERTTPLSERGIRNGIDKLKLSLSTSLKEKIGDKANHCRNFNHLTNLHRECKPHHPQTTPQD